ncbi:hypothetical protein HBI37_113040 [Parastagonospora nodorum]|nr:hypothetical protein HBI16_026360 [Parastagonospora nodorum]KAH6339875.1 hypothetical protein HBI37_113040 [Parastagonospora nodorum]KAH6372062.1 hypothetical protein HBI36_014040 [Parastagonospora nodorum]
MKERKVQVRNSGTSGGAAKQRTALGLEAPSRRKAHLHNLLLVRYHTFPRTSSSCIASYVREPNLHQLRNILYPFDDSHRRMTRIGKHGHAHAGLSTHAP